MIKDDRGRDIIIHEASLSSYIINAERLATPIYPHDASAIVSMMDIHPDRPGELPAEEGEEGGASEPFEVFEAGTGMGSLTLHIARALHAGNRPLSREMREAVSRAEIKRRSMVEQAADAPEEAPPIQSLTLSRLDVPDEMGQQLQEWRESRGVVLHSLDRNPTHAREAFKFVRRFRRGMYLPTVDFHIGAIPDYLNPRLEASGGKPFLSRAVLDLPAAHDVAEVVVRALRPNGLLVVFNPSISQIAEVAAWSVKTGQRLRLEKVTELANTTSLAADDGGLNDGGGGRTWDLRTVLPKKEAAGGEVVQVMRPKVGDRIAGGGFVAVFRKFPAERPVADGDAEGDVKTRDEGDVALLGAAALGSQMVTGESEGELDSSISGSEDGSLDG